MKSDHPKASRQSKSTTVGLVESACRLGQTSKQTDKGPYKGARQSVGLLVQPEQVDKQALEEMQREIQELSRPDVQATASPF